MRLLLIILAFLPISGWSYVQVTDFNGVISNGQVTLSWNLAPSHDFDILYIERRPELSADYKIIGKILSSDDQIKSFTDFTPQSGLNEYRLRIVSADESELVSSSVFLNNPGLRVVVYPNPVVKEVHIFLPDGCNNDAGLSLELNDSYGRPVVRKTIRPNLVRFELQEFERAAAGVYTLRFFDGPRLLKAIRLVKQ